MSYCGWESDKNNKAILYGDLYMGLPFTTHVGSYPIPERRQFINVLTAISRFR